MSRRDPGYWVLVAALALVFWWVRHEDSAPPPPVAQAPAVETGRLANYEQAKVRVTMYSLTTCPYCKAMRRELTARHIPFVEYFIDAEPGRMREVTDKLAHAGYRPGAIGTPILEVNGIMLPNSPSIATVLRHLEQG